RGEVARQDAPVAELLGGEVPLRRDDQRLHQLLADRVAVEHEPALGHDRHVRADQPRRVHARGHDHVRGGAALAGPPNAPARPPAPPRRAVLPGPRPPPAAGTTSAPPGRAAPANASATPWARSK